MRKNLLRISCDLCGFYDTFREGQPADGWIIDEWPNGDLVDLCRSCARDVAPLSVGGKPP